MPLIAKQLFIWFFAPKPLLATALCCLMVVSALGVAFTSHETRNMYRDLQRLQKTQDDLEHEYEKLLLEQSAWADYTRLNELAQDKLEMSAPETRKMVVLR